MTCIVQDWFGSAFSDLHPLLQALHRNGGVLRGPVDVRFGERFAGVLGRRIARRLGIVCESGANQLEVRIFSDERALHWNRCFNDCAEFRSTFVPIERFPHGHWRESSGPIQMLLQVVIVNSGWHWRHLRTYAFGIPLPAWLAPRTIAYKEIEGDGYRFSVDIGLPLLGTLLSYSGKLRACLHANKSDPSPRHPVIAPTSRPPAPLRGTFGDSPQFTRWRFLARTAHDTRGG